MKDDKYEQLVRRNRHSAGWSLVGTMLGGAAISMLIAGGSVLYDDYKQDLQAQGRGRQLGSALTQLETYSRKYHAALTAGSGVAGVAIATAPTTAELRTLGFAAVTYADDSQPGGALLFRIEREPAGCAAAKCVLHLTVITSGSVREAGKVDESMARQIAGYVPHGAGWSNDPDKAHNLIKNGNALPNPLGSVPAVVAAKLWLGNNQSSQIVPPPSYSYRDVACQSGYSGYLEQRRTTTTDKWGNTTTGSWTTVGGQCTKDEPPPQVVTPPATSESPGSSTPPVTTTPPQNSGGNTGNNPGGGSGGNSGGEPGGNSDGTKDGSTGGESVCCTPPPRDDPPPPPPPKDDPPPPPPPPPQDPYLEYCQPSKSQFGDWYDDCR